MIGENRLNLLAEEYVRLALAMDAHDPGYVDAYFGPPVWKKEAQLNRLELKEIESRSSLLLDDLSGFEADDRNKLRLNYLESQSKALLSFTKILLGLEMDFDEESEALYGIRSMGLSETNRDKLLDGLDGLLPGKEDIPTRYDSYMNKFRIHPSLLIPLIEESLHRSRKVTNEKISLPADSFNVNLIEEAPWEAYNWYLGEKISRIDINSGIPITVDRVILYACHEAYPGHHTMWCMRDEILVKKRGWLENSIVAIRSPLALVAEGAAQYGVDLVFPKEKIIDYYVEELFPALGLPAEEADRFEMVTRLGNDLMFRGWVNTTRDLINRVIDRDETIERMCSQQLMSREMAKQYLLMMGHYRSYVINYSAGYDLVKQYVESHPNRWSAFQNVLSEPMTIAGLR